MFCRLKMKDRDSISLLRSTICTCMSVVITCDSECFYIDIELFAVAPIDYSDLIIEWLFL